MTKIDKTDLENINFLKKELKIKEVQTVKIKKGNYEIEISSITKDESSKGSKMTPIEESSAKTEKRQHDHIKPENIVKSPMVGVAYLSSDPEAQSYIKEGQHVKQGDILMLIEAMKTFNEIRATKSGVIKKITVLNSQPVEFGETLVIFE